MLEAKGTVRNLQALSGGIYLSTVTLPIIAPDDGATRAVPLASDFKVRKSLEFSVPFTVMVPNVVPAAILSVLPNVILPAAFTINVCNKLATGSKYTVPLPEVIKPDVWLPFNVPVPEKLAFTVNAYPLISRLFVVPMVNVPGIALEPESIILLAFCIITL